MDVFHNIFFNAIIFVCAFVLSAFFVWIVKKYACYWGLSDIPSERKMHDHIIPRGGGIGIFLGMMSAYFLAWLLLYYFDIYFPFIEEYLNQKPFFWRDVTIIVIGAIIVFLTGLLDDFFDLSPWTKIMLESLVAFFLIAYDIRITLFINNFLFSAIITWAWVLLITNSFNLLDNMDGLSAGVAFIASTFLLIVAIQTNQWLCAFLLIGLLGSILGFLCYNFPPVTIFMGDSGSLTLGYMMSVLTIYMTFSYSSIFPVTLPVLVLAVPLFDTFTVIILRLQLKVSIFKADKRHFSHRLVNLGLTPKRSVLLIYFLTFATGLSALLLYQLTYIGSLIVILQMFVILLIIHTLEQAGNHTHHESK
ncbi:MAG: undecaprenyl/decaprenyl-phosphate alpha-N-acetylglucosaminyl 1-phosphate transferase [Planctomycetes bacterium]|nr:undecaprenyl/decaprenyl-phosphate alpha-N-acetylglucosaminyl 1-phosphate transferase [Planctomycetota bacterium]